MRPQNKAHRVEIKQRKFINRLKLYGFYKELGKPNVNFNCYRTTSTPCSCHMCQGGSYSRKIKHKKRIEDE